MEAKEKAVQKNITSNQKGFDCLKNFIIPKKTSDKGLLTECFADQRDYSDVKQRLNQSCLDKECNLESLWHFDKIQMVHNKDLEEDFVAKRSQLRKEGRQDEEHSNFLVVAKDEVSKICQSGLRTSCSTKKELSIMKELGNPQLGVYLFRYVDIALNYASKHSIKIENIIIFRVLLGKVKKIQPPKGKKKVALDPTPNFDCHVSRISPSVKDSVEDQTIGSLIYFYEYNELSKPVDKPRQCLPYAVVKVKRVNQKVVVEYPIASFMKSKPKIIPMGRGRGRGRPPGNCTRVTRIDKDKLFYEHFRKPEEIKQDHLMEIKESVSSFSACDSCSSTVITSRQIKDPRLMKREQILGKQDGKMENNLKIPTTLILPSTVPENFFPNNSESAFSYSQFMEKLTWKEWTLEECVSPFLVYKGNDYSVIGEQGLGNINQFSKENLASPNTHIGDHTLKNNVSYDSSISDTNFNRVSAGDLKREERTNDSLSSPLNSFKTLGNDWKSQESEPVYISTDNRKQEFIPQLPAYFDKNISISKQNPQSEDNGNTNLNRVSAGDLKREERTNGSLSSPLNSFKTLCNEWKFQESEPVYISADNRKQEFIPQLPAYDKNIGLSNQEPESEDNGNTNFNRVSAGDLKREERTNDSLSSPLNSFKTLGNDWKSQESEPVYISTDNRKQEFIPQLPAYFDKNISLSNQEPESENYGNANLNSVSAGDLKREERTNGSRTNSSSLNSFKTLCNEWKSQGTEPVYISADNRKQEFIPQLPVYDKNIGLSNQEPESEDYGNTNFNKLPAGDLNREERTNDSLSSPLNSFKTLGNEWKSQESEPVYISMDNRKQELIPQLPVYFDTKISISNQKPESVTSSKDEMDNRGKQRIKLQSNDDYTSEIPCKTDYDTRCSKNNCNSLERENNDNYETGSVLDYTLESAFHRKNYQSDHTFKEDWTENNCERSRGYQMSEEDCKQNKSQAVLQYEKHSMTERPQQTNKQIYSTSERTKHKETKEEYIINKANDSSFKENISDINIMYSSHMTFKSDEMRDLDEECIHIFKEDSLDKILRDNEECPLSKVSPVPCINEQMNLETDGIICTCDFDQVHTMLQLEKKSGKKKYTPELQILVSENVCDQQDIFIFLEERINREGGQRKETEYYQVTKTKKQVENNPDRLSSSDYRLSSMPLDDDLVFSSNHYLLQGPEGEEEETKKDFSGLEPHAIRDIPAKPLVEVALDQKHTTPSKESTCRQFSLKDTNKIVRLPSPVGIISEWGINNFTATDSLPHVLPNTTNQNLESKLDETNLESKRDEKCLSNEYPADSEDMRLTDERDELKYLDLITKISGILQKADETSSLNILHKQAIFCRNVLPKVIKSFEIKQGCSFEQVLVFREIVGSAEKNMWAGHKLKSCAIESLIELQIIMETIEFIENKKRLIEGELTFRSLLWYDDSLYSELFGGQSGYQQQSNFFPAFQRRLKYNAFNELQSYHKQLVEVFENTRWQNHSYYSYLKSRREIVECEAALKSSSCFSDFFLSVPYVCGANFGDTLDDLENTRKSTVDLIKVCKNLPGVAFSAEKEDHLWIIMEIIGTKIEFIKTCEEVNMKASLFGLEHIFFDAAKSLAWREKNKFINKDAKEQNLKINECALSTFYGIYEHMVKKLEDGNFCSAPEENVLRNSSEESYNCEKRSVQQETNYITNSLVLHLDIGYINKILDEAQSASVNKLQRLMCTCTEHFEFLEKCFQILQEENISNVLITKENVLGFMTSSTVNAVILKPETVEVYTEMAMIYETVSFLKNSIARKVNKPRFRSLLWFDDSLLPELLRSQERIASFSYRKDDNLKVIESSIAELQDELSVVCDYAETLNSSYAVHILTRELRELSETRNLLQASKSSISMCVDFVPYTVSLNYGSTVSELDCNYNQFSLLLEKLMLADTKDLGKMAHVMKIMKTIEHMKFVCTELGKSPLPVVIFQMLKNWRKSCQLKRQGLEIKPDPNERHSTKHSSYFRDTQSLNTAAGSKAKQKRLAIVTSEDDSCTYEEKDYSFHRKKRKIVAALMTTTKKTYEKENSRNLRKSAKYNSLKDKEQHLNISAGITWNTKVDDLKGESPISPSSYDKINKDTSISSTKLQLPVQIDKNSATSVAKLGGKGLLLDPVNEHSDLKLNVPGNTCEIIPDCSTAISLASKHDKIEKESEKIPVSQTPSNYSDSSAVTEISEMEPLHTELSSSENTKNSVDSSTFSPNENVKETSQMQSYRTTYPWYICQNGSSSHSVTQMYQEGNSYETYQLCSGITATTNTVYNAESSMFCSQTLSQYGVEESQSCSFLQSHPIYGCFSSSVPLYSYQQPSSWYPQAAFPSPANMGM